MGANQQTSVPAFVTGQVLTAEQQTWINTGIPVFATTTTRDAAFGGTGEKVLAEGQFAYLEDSNTTQYYDGSSWIAVGKSGLTLISATTIGSAVSTVTVSNAFSATYDNYRIIISGGASSVSDAGLTLTVGSKVTGYKSVLYYQDWSNSGAVVLGNTSTYAFCGRTGTNGHSAIIDITAPFLAKNTTIASSGTSPTYNVWAFSNTNDTTSYTAFTLDRSAGTLTGGVIYVYGYANS